MNPQHHPSISEAALDKLLQEAFIDAALADEKNVDVMARYIFSDETVLTPASHNAAVLEKLIHPGAAGKFSGKIWFFTTLIAVSASLFFFFNRHQSTVSAFPVSTNTERQEDHPAVSASSGISVVSASLPGEQNTEAVFDDTTNHREINPVVYDTGFITSKNRAGISKSHPMYEEDDDEGDEIPQLSDKELKQHEKDKRSLLEKFAYKKSFGWIPDQTVITEHETLQTEIGFRITETSVQEYRVFLNDLIVQHRYSDYRKALPDAAGWTKAGYPHLDSVYMTRGYNEFPVVNISREAAVLFCEWLTASVNEAAGNGELRSATGNYISFMLPQKKMWLEAARGKDSIRQFPEIGLTDSLQNKQGCSLANFNAKKSEGKLRTLNVRCSSNSARALANVTTAGKVIDSLVTAPVTSYNLNKIGLFCIAGNVAEMCWDGPNALAMGGSWNSGIDDMKLNSPNQYQGLVQASPEIGFRVVRYETAKPFLQKVTYTATHGADSGQVKEAEVPVLRQDKLAETDRQKKKMIRELQQSVSGKSKSASYIFVPMGTRKSGNRNVSYMAFYMQKTEVTNQQYRTFLFDLLQQKRYEDYVAAMVHESEWKTKAGKSNGSYYEQLYFYHPVYDNYPVVNISRAGAMLYCNWLTTEMNRSAEPGKHSNVQLRLPMELEWEAAASSGERIVKYPWGGPNLRNAKGSFLCNFKADSVSSSEAIMGQYELMAAADSYFPNDFGFYNMAGNAAEMVWTMDEAQGSLTAADSLYLSSVKKNPYDIPLEWRNKVPHIYPESKGGSWNCKGENVQIVSPDENRNITEPKPWIGFRPVMTFTGRSEND